MCPLQEAKFSSPSSELEHTTKERSPRVPSSRGSYLVITRLIDLTGLRPTSVIGVRVEA